MAGLRKMFGLRGVCTLSVNRDGSLMLSVFSPYMLWGVVFTCRLVFCENVSEVQTPLNDTVRDNLLWVMAISCSILKFSSDPYSVNVVYRTTEQHTP